MQSSIYLGAKHYIQAYNLDISFETESERGAADFKMSSGVDITVGEVKLSSNGQYLHGYTVQIEEIAIAMARNRKILYLLTLEIQVDSIKSLLSIKFVL